MKTIFVYGFNGYKNQSKVAGKLIKDMVCFEYKSNLKQSIEEIAYELNDFVKNNAKKGEKINLIGVSAGGIISDYYAKFIDPKKVSKLATICSPFKGSYLAFFYPKKRKGLKELLPNSDFLKKLDSRKLGKNKTINFYSFFDILVPFNSGRGENPKHTWNFFHFLIQNDRRILKKTKEFF